MAESKGEEVLAATGDTKMSLLRKKSSNDLLPKRKIKETFRPEELD